MDRRARYLFIRILEACNADCFMCNFALSRDTYRFSTDEMTDVLPKAAAAGVKFIRFTGGEPLMHPEVVELVHLGSEAGMRTSIISNGLLLPRLIDALATAGLAQMIVSLDGASSATHDVLRRLPGSFDNGMAGLGTAAARGVLTRVNTVVGPHNYTEIPRLQEVLTAASIQQRELSALKLNRPIAYPDPDNVRSVCDAVYARDDRLVPMGKKFYGDTATEQQRFFTEGIPPRADQPSCHIVEDVIYLDAKDGSGYACSCLPRRDHENDLNAAPLCASAGWSFDTPAFLQHREFYAEAGPRSCSGCSATNAGYSNDVARMGEVASWSL
jgi:cytosylglucuronate decarboxylase